MHSDVLAQRHELDGQGLRTGPGALEEEAGLYGGDLGSLHGDHEGGGGDVLQPRYVGFRMLREMRVVFPPWQCEKVDGGE